MCKSCNANVCVYNGVREVQLRTDEVDKQKIPHLVKLENGQSILFTMFGGLPSALNVMP